MRPNLLHMVTSIAAHTEECVNFNMFTDERSQPVIGAVFDKARLPNRFQVRRLLRAHAVASRYLYCLDVYC